MNLHLLADVLQDNAPDQFLKEIGAEVAAYRDAFRIRGSSRPIHVTGDNFHFTLRREHVRRLCSLFLQGALDQWELQYAANAIDLASSFQFEDQEIEEAIFQLADPEINSPLSVATVE